MINCRHQLRSAKQGASSGPISGQADGGGGDALGSQFDFRREFAVKTRPQLAWPHFTAVRARGTGGGGGGGRDGFH